VDGIRNAVKRVEGELEERLVVGAGRSEDAGEVAGGEAGNVLPGDHLRAGVGGYVLVVVPLAGKLIAARGSGDGITVGGLGQTLQEDVL
jgi:hypothetical protein